MFTAFVVGSIIGIWLLIGVVYSNVVMLRARVDAQAKIIQSLSDIVIVQCENLKFQGRGLAMDIDSIRNILEAGADDNQG